MTIEESLYEFDRATFYGESDPAFLTMNKFVHSLVRIYEDNRKDAEARDEAVRKLLERGGLI